jgi:hypothetical protein
MVALLEVPRNAEGPPQSEGRAKEGYPKSAAKDNIKGGARKPRPAAYLLILCAAATKIKRVLLRLLARLGVDHDLA